jgi:hypothetical protein
MALNLLRNARLFVTTSSGTTGLDDDNTWEIPLLSDFSFSQAAETTDITVSEAGATPTRGGLRFSTALNPVDWSFSTYMRPYKINALATNVSTRNEHRCLERILWHGLVSANNVNFAATGGNADAKATSTTSFDIVTTGSNVHRFTTLYLLIKADNVWYRIAGVQVNQAEVDFGIDTIGQITWSGFGTTMTKLASAPTTTGSLVKEYSSPTVLTGNSTATALDMDFVIQKYTRLTITDNRNTNGHTAQAYTLPITGGTLTFNNNITYLTPETLGIVNTPIGSFTGSREITGSVSAYLKTGTAGDAGDLLEDLLGFTSETTTSYKVDFVAGGVANTDPTVQFVMNNCHVSIPTVDVQDVLSVNIDFKATPYSGSGASTTGDLTFSNELSVKYIAINATSSTSNDN